MPPSTARNQTSSKSLLKGSLEHDVPHCRENLSTLSNRRALQTADPAANTLQSPTVKALFPALLL